MEVELVILKLVEELLDRGITLQRHSEVSVSAMRISIFEQEQNGLHILEVGARARGVFLRQRKHFEHEAVNRKRDHCDRPW